MKQHSILSIFIGLMLSISFTVFSNDLNKIEIFQGNLSTQFLLIFSNECDFSIAQNKNNRCFSVIFKGAHDVIADKEALLKKLRETSPALVKNIVVKNNQQGVEVDFFCENDQVYIRCHPLETKNRYVIEIFSLKALEHLQNHSNSPLLFAFSAMSDPKKKMLPVKKPRIVLDSGHGGEAKGAQGFFGLVEKNVALEVTKKVKNLLEKSGYQVILTRDRDCDKSLLERSEIAYKSGADLFISIHANSSGGAPEPQGIETFHVNADRLCVAENGGYDHVLNTAQSRIPFRKLTNSLIQSKEHHSHGLADSIQAHILSILQQHHLKPVNRGVKKALFNVLLRGHIPSALVEIGFLTNEHEAALLSQEPYKNLIAQGISNGIDRFCQKISAGRS